MRTNRQRIIAAMVMLAFGGCDRAPPPAPAAPPAPKLSSLPVEMRVKQRSTTAVPGSDAHLRLTIDDITRGQVMASFATEMGEPVMAPCSMRQDGTEQFRFGGAAYQVKLTKLENALIGEDWGTFVISAGAEGALTEDAKIERLIQGIATLQGATFIRNGAEHTAPEAADHLHLKLRAKAADIKSAAQFIELLASKSSLSGDPYQIRFADGHVEPCGDYLRAQLALLEHPGTVEAAHAGTGRK